MKHSAEVIGGRYAVGIALTAIGLFQLLLIGISFIQCRLCRNAAVFLFRVTSVLPVTISLGSFCLFTTAYLLGRRAGRKIINDKQPFWWSGSITALATFFLITCIMVLAGNIEMAPKMNVQFRDSLEGILPGLVTILIIGMYPATGLGMIYGELVKRKGEKSDITGALQIDDRSTQSSP